MKEIARLRGENATPMGRGMFPAAVTTAMRVTTKLKSLSATKTAVMAMQ
jgi:hypothetical protein